MKWLVRLFNYFYCEHDAYCNRTAKRRPYRPFRYADRSWRDFASSVSL